MTSKISSGKLLRESMKQCMGFGVLLFLGYFCYFPLGGLLLQQTQETEYLLTTLEGYGKLNPMLLLAVCAAAVILGILQFAYLHNKEKTDFFHSIPIKRESLFMIQYSAGILIWLFAYGSNLLLFLFTCVINRSMTSDLLQAVGNGYLMQLTIFMMLYSLTILAMVLTGKIYAGILGFGVFCIYAPAVVTLSSTLMEVYFRNYASEFGLMENPIFRKLTPLYVIFGFLEPERIGNRWFDLSLGVLLGSILLAGISLLIYRKRPSEAAGKTIAFYFVERVIKFLLVIPMAFVVHEFFLLTSRNVLWGIFGLLFGLILSSVFIEFIYTMDIKECFRDRRQLLFTTIAALSILGELQFDLSGYETWMPKNTEVSGAKIQIERYYRPRTIYEKHVTEKDGSWYSWVRHEETGIYRTEDVQQVKEIVAVSNIFEEKRNLKQMLEDASYGSESYVPIMVTWELNDGREKARRYFLRENEVLSCFAEIWDSPEYKTELFPVLKDEPKMLQRITLTDYNAEEVQHYSSEEQNLSEEELSEFLAIFQEELYDYPMKEWISSWYNERIDLELLLRMEDGTYCGDSFGLPQKGFEKSLRLLEKYGMIGAKQETEQR